MKVTAKLLTCLCALLLFAGLTATAALAADQTAPTLVSTSPANGATVAANIPIKLTFSEPIVTTDNEVCWYSNSPVTVQVQGDYRYIEATVEDDVITLHPYYSGRWGRPDGQKVVVTIKAGEIKDLAGNAMSVSKQITFSLKDITGPWVQEVIAGDSSGIDPTMPIKLFFSEKLLPGENYNAIQVTNRLGQTAKVTKTINDNVLTIAPASGAWDDERGYIYTLKIPAKAVKDALGNNAESYATDFITVDNKPPKLLAIMPANGATNVRLDAPFVLVFDESISLTGNQSHYSLVSSNPINDQAHSYGLNHDGNTLIIYPYDSPVWNNGYSTTYTLNILGNEISDTDGRYITTKITTKFTTIGLLSAKPGSPKASSAGYNSVKLSWTALPGTTKYEVWRATSKTGKYTNVAETTSASFNNSGLTTNTTYYYKVRAYQLVEGKKYYSAWSDIVSAKPTATPGNVKVATITSSSIEITWDTVDGATKYEVWRTTNITGTFTLVGVADNTTYKDYGLTIGKTYYYKVRAYRLVGNTKVFGGWSAVVSATPIPTGPNNVKATPVSSSSAKITWNTVTGAKNYEVWRATSQTGTYTRVGMTAATSFTNTGLTTNTTYYYKVRAYLSVGGKNCFSTWSSVVSAKPIPAPPGNVKATAVSSSSVKITWNTVTGAMNYEVWRAASQTGTYTRVGMTAATSFTNTGLTTNTTYYYKVRAYLSVGGKNCFSTWSSVVSAKPIPAPPGNVKATAVSSSSVKITWNTVTGAMNYEVWRAASQTGTYTRVGMTAATSFTNTGLTTNTTYYYKVRAYLSVGGKNCFSAWSAVVSAKPIPAPPSNVKAAPVTSSSAKITWNMVTGAKNYEVWRAASPTGTYTRVGMTAATSFTNTGLTTNTTYYYKVRAYLSVGGKNCFSAWSTVVSAKP